jgi:hypothetical protein
VPDTRRLVAVFVPYAAVGACPLQYAVVAGQATCERSLRVFPCARLDNEKFGNALIITPDGWFAASIVHPCFPGNERGLSSWPPDAGYTTEGWWTSPEHDPDGVRVRVGSNHRTVST